MADTTPDYPGKKFGLPMTGPSSVAPMGRRLAALIIDWALCYLIASSIVRHNVFTVTDAHYQDAQLVALLLFVVEVYLLTAISGLTVGKRLLGLRAVRTNGDRPGFGWAAVRTLLLLFVVPACLSDRDLRGLHDRAADTIVVRMLSPARCYPRGLGIRGWRAPLGIGPFGACIVGWSAFSR
ncbi:MAG TPA: RDD family protein [Trebonia sp.]|nr:RDD family protein [Trebonia sp.]